MSSCPPALISPCVVKLKPLVNWCLWHNIASLGSVVLWCPVAERQNNTCGRRMWRILNLIFVGGNASEPTWKWKWTLQKRGNDLWRNNNIHFWLEVHRASQQGLCFKNDKTSGQHCVQMCSRKLTRKEHSTWCTAFPIRDGSQTKMGVTCWTRAKLQKLQCCHAQNCVKNSQNLSREWQSLQDTLDYIQFGIS
mgnify:CR=1 FL=1